MKSTLTSIRQLQPSQFLLVAVAAALVAIYMTLLSKAGDTAHLGMSGLFWLAIGSLIWEKRHKLILESSILPSLVGILLIAIVLWQAAVVNVGHFLRISPLISAVAVGLLASGFKGLKQYWGEFAILFFLGVPSVMASFLADISPITAKFSAFLLWYSGFEVQLRDVYVILPTGSVKVYAACSGMEAMTYVLGLSVICLVMFPIGRSKQIIAPIVAIAIGFVVNAIRVAVLAILAAHQNQAAFDYWHEGEGSLIFGMIAVGIFGLFYFFLMHLEESRNQDRVKSLKK